MLFGGLMKHVSAFIKSARFAEVSILLGFPMIGLFFAFTSPDQLVSLPVFLFAAAIFSLFTAIYAFNGFAGTPSFSVEPGLYYTAQYVEISIPEGTQVFYTTDGSVPTQMSTPYNGERLELNKPCNVLRARAFSTGLTQPGEIVTGTWFVNVYHALPVVSIVTDPSNLWDEEWGMLTIGKDAIKEPGKLPFPNTVYRKVKNAGIKYDCHVELYDKSNNILLSQGAEIVMLEKMSPVNILPFCITAPIFRRRDFRSIFFRSRPS